MDAQDRTHALVAKAQAGDRDAFDGLVARYWGRVVSLIRRRLGPELAAHTEPDDLAQEVFLRAYSSIARFRWSGDAAFFRWLSTIARHVILEAARRAGRDLLLPSDEDFGGQDVSAGRALGRRDRLARLRLALDRLKPEHREVILLTRIRRIPVRDAAAHLGRSPKATSQLLIRALEKLKDEFGDTESLGLPVDASLDDEAANDA